MNFSEALHAAKSNGDLVARLGWNGKSMFVFYVPGYRWSLEDRRWQEFTKLGFFALKTADDTIVPWVASQSDMVADDWHVAEDPTEGLPEPKMMCVHSRLRALCPHCMSL